MDIAAAGGHGVVDLSAGNVFTATDDGVSGDVRDLQEAAAEGKKRITPYWRTLKSKGELNPKYPGGIESLTEKLEAEGVTVSRRGSGTFVAERRQRLRDEERKRRIEAALDALLSEATHLGLTEREVRDAFEEVVTRYRHGLGPEEGKRER